MLKRLISIITFLFLATLPIPAQAASGQFTNHLVISQIQIAGATVSDEFVELYNPTAAAINLKDLKLTKKTASGNEYTLVSAFPDFLLQPYSYYLITHANYQGSVAKDIAYSSSSNSIAADNTVVLYDSTSTVIDLVGLGAASVFEGAATSNPAALKVVERKPGGAEAVGNGIDTNNNLADFLVGQTPSPHNSSMSEYPAGFNQPPQLSFVGDANYGSSAVYPTHIELGSSATFRIKYQDAENEAPQGGTVTIWLDKNFGSVQSPTELVPMQEEDLTDTNFKDGKVYVYEYEPTTEGTINYRFIASDQTGNSATGQTQTFKDFSVGTNRSLKITKPAANEFLFGTYQLVWEAEGLASFNISIYDGSTWKTIATGITTNHLDINTANYPNGSAKFKVEGTSGTTTLSSTIDISVNNINPGDVTINEVEYDPPQAGTDTAYEWVELFNTSKRKVNTQGLTITDAKESDELSNFWLEPGRYVILAANKQNFQVAYGSAVSVVEIPDQSLGNGLSNSGDSLTLKHGATTISECFFGRSKAGYTLALNNNLEYDYTATSTPGKENIFSSAGGTGGSPELCKNISAAKQKEGYVLVRGIVNVEPGILGKQVFYIQDSSAGLQVYNYKGSFPNLRNGDYVEVLGSITTSAGEYRIKTTSATDIKVVSQSKLVSVKTVKSGSVSEEDTGQLVFISGRITQTSGSTFYVDDGSGDVKVYIKSSAEIDKPRFSKGASISLRGIVSETTSGLRILPRYQYDLSYSSASRSLASTSYSSLSNPSATPGTQVASSKSNNATAPQSLQKPKSDLSNILYLAIFIVAIGAIWYLFIREKHEDIT